MGIRLNVFISASISSYTYQFRYISIQTDNTQKTLLYESQVWKISALTIRRNDFFRKVDKIYFYSHCCHRYYYCHYSNYYYDYHYHHIIIIIKITIYINESQIDSQNKLSYCKVVKIEKKLHKKIKILNNLHYQKQSFILLIFINIQHSRLVGLSTSHNPFLSLPRHCHRNLNNHPHLAY